jgi:hypothetical protein
MVTASISAKHSIKKQIPKVEGPAAAHPLGGEGRLR